MEERHCWCHPPLLLPSSPSSSSPSPVVSVACQSWHWPKMCGAHQHQSCMQQPHYDCGVWKGQHCSHSHCLSTRSIFDFIFWDLWQTCWARIQSMAPTSKYPIALMAVGIESLVAGFALHARKKRAALLAWSSTLYSFHFKDMLKCLLLRERKWVAQAMHPKEKETITIEPNYRVCVSRLWRTDPPSLI